jgi:hypothetical protein
MATGVWLRNAEDKSFLSEILQVKEKMSEQSTETVVAELQLGRACLDVRGWRMWQGQASRHPALATLCVQLTGNSRQPLVAA